MRMKNVVLLGSTGSIGTSTVKVAEDLAGRIRLVGLAAGNNVDLLVEQAKKFQPEAISISDPSKIQHLQSRLGTDTPIHSGNEGLIRLATLPSADIVLIAIVGTAGLQPALAAIRAGKDIAVASKEILVMAGGKVIKKGRQQKGRGAAGGSGHLAL